MWPYCELSFTLLDLYSFKKKSFDETEEKYKFYDEFVYRPGWLTVSDSQSGIKFMISVAVKFLIRIFILVCLSVPTYKKRATFVISTILSRQEVAT